MEDQLNSIQGLSTLPYPRAITSKLYILLKKWKKKGGLKILFYGHFVFFNFVLPCTVYQLSWSWLKGCVI